MPRGPYVRFFIHSDLQALMEIDALTSDAPLSDTQFIDYSRAREWRVLVLADKNIIQAFAIVHDDGNILGVDRMGSHPDFGDELAWSFFLRDLREKIIHGTRSRLVLLVNERDLIMELFLKEQGFFATQTIRRAVNGDDIIRFEFGVDLIQEMGPR